MTNVTRNGTGSNEGDRDGFIASQVTRVILDARARAYKPGEAAEIFLRAAVRISWAYSLGTFDMFSESARAMWQEIAGGPTSIDLRNL